MNYTQTEPENGHVRIGARQAWALTGAIVFMVCVWAVSRVVALDGNVQVIETTQGHHTERIEDIEGRTRRLEQIKAAEDEHVRLLREQAEQLKRIEERVRRR